MTPAQYRKIACPFCKGHIEFEADRGGQLAACPHCSEEILLESISDLHEAERKAWRDARGPRWPLAVLSILGIAVAAVILVALQAIGSETSGMLGALGLLVLGVLTYFAPTFVADRRKARNRTGIFILNLFLGWTVVGWVAALIWAYWEDKP